jgi:ribosome-associated toxin RatA of RatAB toxin-antitoxin module
MRKVTMEMEIDGMPPDKVYERISHFERYPDLTDAVRQVEILGGDESGRERSRWEINFRDGIMRWEEEDTFRPDEHRITFSAIDGDVQLFDGEWQVQSGQGGNSLLRFSAEFDLGLATLNDMIEPIADEALRESIELIVTGVTEGRAKVVEGAPAASADGGDSSAADIGAVGAAGPAR